MSEKSRPYFTTQNAMNQIHEINLSIWQYACFKVKKIKCHCKCAGVDLRNGILKCVGPCYWSLGTDISTRLLNALKSFTRGDLYVRYFHHLKEELRADVLSWLALISSELTLERNTYHLAVDYFDKYLEAKGDIPDTKLRLLAITCLFVASKYEEVRPPTINKLSRIIDGNSIIIMEIEVLNAIDFECSMWTANNWLNIYLHIIDCEVDVSQYDMMTALLDVSILDPQSLNYMYHSIAAAVICIVLNDHPIPEEWSTHLDNGCSEWIFQFYLELKKQEQLYENRYIQSNHRCLLLYKCTTYQRYMDNLATYKNIKAKRLF